MKTTLDRLHDLYLVNVLSQVYKNDLTPITFDEWHEAVLRAYKDENDCTEVANDWVLIDFIESKQYNCTVCKDVTDPFCEGCA